MVCICISYKNILISALHRLSSSATLRSGRAGLEEIGELHNLCGALYQGHECKALYQGHECKALHQGHRCGAHTKVIFGLTEPHSNHCREPHPNQNWPAP